jgi:hypothetical protein
VSHQMASPTSPEPAAVAAPRAVAKITALRKRRPIRVCFMNVFPCCWWLFRFPRPGAISIDVRVSRDDDEFRIRSEEAG